jgi:ankyrin repeat protein
MTELFYTAALNGDMEKLKTYYEKLPIDSVRATALYWGCFANHLEVIDFFINQNFDFNTFTEEGKSIISGAASSRQDDSHITLEKLINYGLDVNTIDEHGQTPIMFSIMRGNLLNIKLLVDYGANLDFIDKNGLDLLTIANGFEYRHEVIALLKELKIEKEKQYLEKNLNQECKYGNKIKI